MCYISCGTKKGRVLKMNVIRKLASLLAKQVVMALSTTLLVAFPAHAALFVLSGATGEPGDTVELNLQLTESLKDFEGLDFFAPEFSATALQLFGAPSLGPA